MVETETTFGELPTGGYFRRLFAGDFRPRGEIPLPTPAAVVADQGYSWSDFWRKIRDGSAVRVEYRTSSRMPDPYPYNFPPEYPVVRCTLTAGEWTQIQHDAQACGCDQCRTWQSNLAWQSNLDPRRERAERVRAWHESRGEYQTVYERLQDRIAREYAAQRASIEDRHALNYCPTCAVNIYRENLHTGRCVNGHRLPIAAADPLIPTEIPTILVLPKGRKITLHEDD